MYDRAYLIYRALDIALVLRGRMKLGSSDVLDEVFENVFYNTHVFSNRDVLRHDYVPDRLPHREQQIKYIGQTVASVLKGAKCSNIFIYGKTGTGKTAVTKYVLNHLKAKAEEYGIPVIISYINCRLIGTEYRIFAKLCESTGVHVPFTGLSVGEVFERFRKGLDSMKAMLLIVLDEIDTLVRTHGDEILYELTRVNEALENSKISLVGVSNDLRLKQFLDPRILSSLSEEEIVFKPYDADELKNILLERALSAFYEGALSDGALSLCAALAAAEHGDARRALDLLRVAGEVAEREGVEVVTEESVRLAEKRIEHSRVVDALKNLTLHSKLVVMCLLHMGRENINRATTGEIYEVYTELCGELGVFRLTQRRVSTLLNELDVIGLLNAQVLSMGRYGRTKKIHLEVSYNLVRDVFANDRRLSRIVEYEPNSLRKYSAN